MERRAMAVVSLPAITFAVLWTMISRVLNLVGSDSLAAIHFESWSLPTLPFSRPISSPLRSSVLRDSMAFSVNVKI